MPTLTTSAGIALYYETAGDSGARPLVLIHGSGAQLISWHDDFVALLAEAGFFVIRHDNRDVGLSQMTAGPDDVEAHYDLADMADDVIALLDHLAIDRATVVGMSMGGFIAQLVAIRAPERVASLGLMSTSPSSEQEFLVGDHGDGSPVTTPPEHRDRDDYIASFVEGERYHQSPGFEFDAAGAAALAARYFDRGYRPDGPVRQWNALVRGPLERREWLRAVTAPTVIIHGRADRSLHWRAALTMAELIAHSELHLYDGMGHDVPRPLWPQFVDAFARSARRAER